MSEPSDQRMRLTSLTGGVHVGTAKTARPGELEGRQRTQVNGQREGLAQPCCLLTICQYPSPEFRIGLNCRILCVPYYPLET